MSTLARNADPVRDRINLPDGEMALLRWAADDRPRLVFAHANGFCASAAKAMLSRLAGRFDIVAPDLRGHGRSSLPADPLTHRSWDRHAADLIALNAALDRPADIMAGHSMGATSALLAASRMNPSLPLALVEPVLMPPGLYFTARTPFWRFAKARIGLAAAARRRASVWPDYETVMARYRDKPNFARWAPGVLADYLEDGLSPTQDGVRLSCNPAWEAANYEAQAHDPFAALSRLDRSPNILKAQYGSTVFAANFAARRGARIEAADGLGHLAVMEGPERVAEWITGVWNSQD